MPKPSDVVSQVEVLLDGAEIGRTILQNLREVVVDQHTHLPGMFTLRLDDPGLALLEQGPFALTKAVEIKAMKKDGDKVSLIKGEITALEPVFQAGMVAELVIRGYDRAHRLYRESKSKAYVNKKDSDLATEIAQAAGLQATVDATSTVYSHIFQHNQSDLAFLMGRAWRIGYECFVQENKLYFRKPPRGGAGLTLTWGDDLQSFRPRMTLAEQVNEVIVKGWDVERQTAIVGQAKQGHLYPKLPESQESAAKAEQAFGAGKVVLVDQAVSSQAEADILAAARLDELSGAFVEAEGEALRRPDLKAGQYVTLKGLGQRFSGDYLVTHASHISDPTGLRTQFSVRGTRLGLLSEQFVRQPPLERQPGVVTAIVTNTDDPKNWGRVKVKYPWLTDDAESDWARVIGVGAGAEAGFLATPAIGDEVAVVFIHGYFGQPVVLGGLWNGQNKPPPEGAKAVRSEKPLVREWRSRTGHRIVMYDNSDKKIELVSSGGLSVVLDDAAKSITIKAGSDVEVQAETGNLKLSAKGNVDIQAAGQVNIKGKMINLN